MRALWLAAPTALTRYAAVLAGVMLAVGLAAAAAASSPFVRAGVESASLRGEVRSMSKYAAGLAVVSQGGPAATDTARRAAAVRFGRTLPFAGAPVLTSRFYAQVAGAEGNALTIVVMARTNAVAHVVPLAGSGPGAWISIVAAKGAHLRAGDTLALTEFATGSARPPLVHVHVARVYQALDTNLEDPYWANFLQDIRLPDPDAPTPPTYVFVTERTLLRLARRLHAPVANEFEYPVATSRVTYVGAKGLQRTYATVSRALSRRGTQVGAAMGCGGVTFDGKPTCTESSSLSAALLIASRDVAALSATIWLLSACTLGIALLLAAAAGVFLVRRRSDEAQLLFARGVGSVAFGTRIALEAALPTVVGAAAGLGAAVLALRLFAPAGTLDGSTFRTGLRDAAAAGAAGLLLVAAAAGASFPRRHDRAHPWLRRAARVPWEAIPLAGAAAVLGILLAGGGIAHDANGEAHPSLAVFLLPVLTSVGIAGLATRALRRAVDGRGSAAPLTLFLVARRIAAARGVLVAVAVGATTALSVFAYATTLSASVSRGVALKSFVDNGSDVQGVVDPSEVIYSRFPFPAVIVEIDGADAFVSDGRPVDVVATDVAEVGKVIRWGPWGDDPRRVLPRLRRAVAAPGVLPAIASPDLPDVDAIVDQGVRIPIDVVARRAFPGMSAGRPALLVSRSRLRAVAARHHIADPGPGADGVIWAKGDPARIEPALRASNIKPAYLTTFAHIRGDPSVRTARRSYGYLRTIGVAAVVLALLALLLYLQARQRGQVIASALVRRMGMRPSADVGALAAETGAIVAFAFAVGTAVALGAARLVVGHVDPLPQYAPATTLVVPWTTLLAVGAAATALAGLFAAAAVAVAGRSDVSESLRVV